MSDPSTNPEILRESVQQLGHDMERHQLIQEGATTQVMLIWDRLEKLLLQAIPAMLADNLDAIDRQVDEFMELLDKTIKAPSSITFTGEAMHDISPLKLLIAGMMAAASRQSEHLEALGARGEERGHISRRQLFVLLNDSGNARDDLRTSGFRGPVGHTYYGQSLSGITRAAGISMLDLALERDGHQAGLFDRLFPLWKEHSHFRPGTYGNHGDRTRRSAAILEGSAMTDQISELLGTPRFEASRTEEKVLGLAADQIPTIRARLHGMLIHRNASHLTLPVELRDRLASGKGLTKPQEKLIRGINHPALLTINFKTLTPDLPTLPQKGALPEHWARESARQLHELMTWSIAVPAGTPDPTDGSKTLAGRTTGISSATARGDHDLRHSEMVRVLANSTDPISIIALSLALSLHGNHDRDQRAQPALDGVMEAIRKNPGCLTPLARLMGEVAHQTASAIHRGDNLPGALITTIPRQELAYLARVLLWSLRSSEKSSHTLSMSAGLEVMGRSGKELELLNTDQQTADRHALQLRHLAMWMITCEQLCALTLGLSEPLSQWQHPRLPMPDETDQPAADHGLIIQRLTLAAEAERARLLISDQRQKHLNDTRLPLRHHRRDQLENDSDRLAMHTLAIWDNATRNIDPDYGPFPGTYSLASLPEHHLHFSVPDMISALQGRAQNRH